MGGDEKMSKSKGNFLTLRTACPKPDDIRAYRYLVVSSQYRNPLSFTQEAMGAAKGALVRMDKLRKQMDSVLEGFSPSDEHNKSNGSETLKVSKEALRNFEIALADDLSMPRAAASLFQLVKAAETEFKRFKKENDAREKDADMNVSPLDLVGIHAIKTAMDQMDEVFGIFYTVPKLSGTDENSNKEDGDTSIPSEVMDLVEQRTAAKNSKDWEMADSLRDRIQELGFIVKDIKGGLPEVTRVG